MAESRNVKTQFPYVPSTLNVGVSGVIASEGIETLDTAGVYADRETRRFVSFTYNGAIHLHSAFAHENSHRGSSKISTDEHVGRCESSVRRGGHRLYSQRSFGEQRFERHTNGQQVIHQALFA